MKKIKYCPDLYLKGGVFLLGDVFEVFRTKSI